MKRLGLILAMALAGLAASAEAATLYPMEGGNLRRYNQALSLTYAAAPFNVVWTSNICSHSSPAEHPIVLSDRVVQAFGYETVCVSRVDGKGIWHVGSFGHQWKPPSYDSDRDLLYQTSTMGSLVARRPSDGVEMWHYYEGMVQGAQNLGGCAYDQGRIYMGTADEKVICLDADAHTVLWSLPLTPGQHGIDTPALDNGELYVGTLGGDLCRINAATGALVWKVSDHAQSYSTAISLDNTRLFVMTNWGRVECHARSNGALLWSFQTGSFTMSDVSQGPLGLYVDSDDRHIYRLDPNTGAVLWQLNFLGNFAHAAPFCFGNVVLASGCASNFYGVDTVTGTNTWNFPHAGSNDFTGFADADGLAFVCTVGGVLYCLQPQNGPLPPTFTPSPSKTPSTSPSATASSTSTVTASATPTSTATPSDSPTASPTATGTASPTRTATASATPSSSPTSTASPSPVFTVSSTVTPSPSATGTKTPGPSQVPTQAGVNGNKPGQKDPGEGQCYMAPNPVYGGPCKLYYHMRAPGTCRLRLYQASGDPVGEVQQHHDSAGLNSCDVSTQRYAAGVYFCKADLNYDDGGKDDHLPLTKFLVLKAR